jgi:hypothetical protein
MNGPFRAYPELVERPASTVLENAGALAPESSSVKTVRENLLGSTGLYQGTASAVPLSSSLLSSRAALAARDLLFFALRGGF